MFSRLKKLMSNSRTRRVVKGSEALRGFPAPYPGQRFVPTVTKTVFDEKGNPFSIPVCGHLTGPGPRRLETMHRKIVKNYIANEERAAAGRYNWNT